MEHDYKKLVIAVVTAAVVAAAAKLIELLTGVPVPVV